ncbi:hypothetical protein KSF78_0007113 [Schistosoma japonicum]|nr:hypothetical protein KSF78_0007113 [Schistosoma japonicum]
MNHHTLINCFKRTIEPNFSKSLKKSSTRSSITEQQNLVEITEKMTKSPKMIDITAKAIKQFNGNNHKQNILTTVRSAKAEAFICIDDYIKQFIHAQYLLTDSNSDEIIHDNSGNNDDDNRANELYELLTPKGDVFTVARLAGIQAAKQTCNIIPLCHQWQCQIVWRSDK